MSKINAIKEFSVVNGEGIRTAVFFSGCTLHCKGCFNQKAQNFDYGEDLEIHMNEIIKSLRNENVDGLSILGGEPMDNQEGVYNLIKEIRKEFGETKTIWCWTGYTLDKIPNSEYKNYILKNIDVLVDGPFVLDKFNPELKFRGSSNQRIIKLK